jgi:propanol-preferring alcohol dehydrogenase
VKMGSEVENLRVGQKGLVYFYIGCRDCEMCRTGRENLCYSIKRLGFELPGGFAEFLKLPAYNFCFVESEMSLDEMAILPDAVATSYHGLKTIASAKVGQDVLIVGVGGLGIHAVQIAKLIGLNTIAAARRNDPLRLAQDLGADYAVNTLHDKVIEKIYEITKGRGVDIVIENVGTAETLSWSLKCLKRGGQLVLVGYDPKNSFPLCTIDMHYNEWCISGSRVSTKQELLEVIGLVESKKIQPVVTKKLHWHRANDAIDGLRSTHTPGRTILTFD